MHVVSVEEAAVGIEAVFCEGIHWGTAGEGWKGEAFACECRWWSEMVWDGTGREARRDLTGDRFHDILSPPLGKIPPYIADDTPSVQPPVRRNIFLSPSPPRPSHHVTRGCTTKRTGTVYRWPVPFPPFVFGKTGTLLILHPTNRERGVAGLACISVVPLARAIQVVRVRGVLDGPRGWPSK